MHGFESIQNTRRLFRITDASDGRRGDQIVHRAGHMPLVIDVTISNVITPDLKDKKGKPLPGVVTKEREIFKCKKYQEACLAVGQSFLPVAFESQGRAGERFLEYFSKQISRRSEEIGIPVNPLYIY